MSYEIVHVDDIIVGTRQRREIDAKHIESLREDIVANGLIHAPTIQGQQLVAGFCRREAVRTLMGSYRYGKEWIEPGYIPVIRIDNLSSSQLFQIELSENLRRKNLSPVDEANAIAMLHTMLQAHNPLQTKDDTAKKLAEIQGKEPTNSPQHTAIGDALLVSSFADDPEVKAAKTKTEAVRIARKKAEQQFTQALGALAKPQTSSDFTLLEGKCEVVMRTLQPESFHGILCDPPYGVDADEFGEQSHAAGHEYKDDEETALDVAHHILELGFSLCKPDAHLYMFCDIRLWPKLCEMAKDRGWRPFATPLIWHKPGLGHAPQPGFFGRRYETILFAQKGNRRLSKSASDVLVCPSVRDKIYAAQKPVELLQEIMGLSWFAGEHILDPTCGSGSVFVAGKSAKLKVTGIELNAQAADIAKARIAELSK